MRSRIAFVLMLLLPHAASADVVSPGYSAVPHHLIIEAADTYPGYHFWLVSPRGIEALDLSSGPCRVDGTNRHGSHRRAYVVAAPVGLAEQIKAMSWEEVLAPEKRPPGVLRSDPIDFSGGVLFYDSRREVIDTYRLELIPGEQLRLVWVAQNKGAWWFTACWIVAGVFAAVGVVWAGSRLLRHRRV